MEQIINRNAIVLPGFFQRRDVVKISEELLGKFLYTNIDGLKTGAIITETEAYEGVTDKASHAYGGRRTQRTEVMYRKGGCSYIYLCYGMHSMFNIVTGGQDEPHAVLIRGVIVVDGISNVHSRLGLPMLKPQNTNGPGKVTRALGLHYCMSGETLTGETIWVEDHGIEPPGNAIIRGPRIGVGYAGEDALLPYRFRIDPLILNNLMNVEIK